MKNKSALVKHVYSQNHHMNWNILKILEKETNYTTKRVLESFLFTKIIMLLMIKQIIFIQLLIEI